MSSPKPEITCTKSIKVYQNPWMSVREDQIVFPDGSQSHYGVVEKPDYAIIVPCQSGQLYLVQQYRYPVGGRFWEFPQGSWEDRATDPLTLARAELREETGLSAASMTHAGRLFQGYGYATQSYDIFLATDLEQLEQNLDLEEQGLISKSFPLSEVESMIMDGTIKDASTVAAFGVLRLKGML